MDLDNLTPDMELALSIPIRDSHCATVHMGLEFDQPRPVLWRLDNKYIVCMECGFKIWRLGFENQA
jgi:hypothetical protein